MVTQETEDGLLDIALHIADASAIASWIANRQWWRWMEMGS